MINLIRLPWRYLPSRLLTHQLLQPLRRGLNRTLVDVTADPSAARFLSNRSRCPGTKKRIKDDITRAAGNIQDSLKQFLRLLRWVLSNRGFLKASDHLNVVPPILQRDPFAFVKVSLLIRHTRRGIYKSILIMEFLHSFLAVSPSAGYSLPLIYRISLCRPSRSGHVSLVVSAASFFLYISIPILNRLL